MSITHRFTSAKSEGADATLVGPNEWNDTHVVSLTSASTQLTSDVALNSPAYTDVISLSLTAGTWIVWATLSLLKSGTATVSSKLWDGSTIYATSFASILTGFGNNYSMVSPPIVLGTTTTIKISMGVDTNTATVLASDGATGATNKATTMVALKIAD